MSLLQPHIKCKKGDIAPYVLLPGDPARIKRIITYWDKARLVANNREFLTYTGAYKGIPISATSTGIGCPSAAIAVEELANIGAKVFIRVGTCGALKEKIKPGELIIPVAAIREEGTSKEYISPEVPAVADFRVYSALLQAAKKKNFKFHTGINRTHDAFYEPVQNMLKWGKLYQDKRIAQWDLPIISSEMECSIVFLLAMLRNLQAGAVFAVVTTEPLNLIQKNPDLVYELIESPKAAQGINHAIQTALEAVMLLQKAKEEKAD